MNDTTNVVSDKISVTMTDGRVVAFPPKTRVSKDIMCADGTVFTTGSASPIAGVRFDFSNGQTRTVPLGVGDLSQRFEAHGIAQKFGDEYSGISDKNSSDPVADSLEAFDDLLERITAGTWSDRKEGGTGAGASVLLRAMAEFSGKTIDELRPILKAMSPKEKAALRMHEEIKPIIDRLEAGKSQVDPEDALANLRARLAGTFEEDEAPL
jgi:hypothetical protein